MLLLTFDYSWLVLILSLYFLQAHGAGVNLHLIYLARVTSDLSREFEPWLRAGAYFPDALYSCKPNKDWHNFAEAAHWPQFLVRAIQLWHDKYQRDALSDDSMRLRNFLVGIFVHQVVDSSWHSLVEGYKSHGLLQVLAQTEFGGSTEKAHNFLDFMGDFIGLGNVNRNPTIDNIHFFTRAEWHLPKEEDMLDLIKCAGADSINISYQDLQICMDGGFSGFVGELFTFLEHRTKILNTAYQISPRAREIIQDHWLGGEFNLVALLQNCLPTLNKLLDGGDELDIMRTLQLCGNLPSEIGVNSVSAPTTLQKSQLTSILRLSTGHKLSNFGASMAFGKFKEDDQLYLAIGAPLEKGKGSIYLILWNDIVDKNTIQVNTCSKPVTLMLGGNIHTYRVEGIDYLLISDPSTNTIYFYRADLLVLTMHLSLKEEANQIQVAKVFEQAHGPPNLLLSSPSYGKYETGCIIIILGKDIASLLKNSERVKIVVFSKASTIVLEGGSWSKPYQHFGSTVEVTSSYAYVNCQSLGLVLVYDLFELHTESFPKLILKEKSTTGASDELLSKSEIVSSQVHGMFGKVICSLNYRGKQYVAVSQHIFSSIFIYQETNESIQFFLRLKLPNEFTHTPYTIGFGIEIKYNTQLEVLYASSPGYFNDKGAIWKISMEEIVRSSEFWKLDTLILSQRKHLEARNNDTSQTGICNFGKTLLPGPNNRLVIGAPQYNYGNLEEDQLTGMVYIL